MLRALLVVSLLGTALSGQLSNCAHYYGYCVGYLTDGNWCYLTLDGRSNYVFDGYGGHHCRDFNGKQDNMYCQDGLSSTKKEVQHSSSKPRHQPSGAGKLSNCKAGQGGYCYGYLQDGNWCYITSDGKSKFVQESYWTKCSSYNGKEDKRWCQDGLSTTEKKAEHQATTKAGKPGKCQRSWSCPSSWTTGGGAPRDAPDAKAFIALNNVYRCMHDVQAVYWDDSVHEGAKKWADYTQTSMVHSTGGSAYRRASDGENLAGTFKSSPHPGVDATHMWYSEIAEPCYYGKYCYQSFSAGHFTAMIWSTINRISFSDPTGELATGRYRGCDGQPPNFNNQYAAKVPPPVHDYATCRATVLACPAFSGITADDIEGCDGQAQWSSTEDWHVVYGSKCADKYANIVSQAARLYNVPKVLVPLAANPWPLAVACSAFFLLLAFAVKRRRASYRAIVAQAPQDHALIETEERDDCEEPQEGLE